MKISRNQILRLVTLITISVGLCAFEISAQTVRISLVSTEPLKRGKMFDLPPPDVKLTFRLHNNSDRDIFVVGERYEKEFDPCFHLIQFDNRTNSWPSQAAMEWSSMSEVKRLRVRKNSSYDFTSTANRGSFSKRLKSAIYYSTSKAATPKMIESEEFTLEPAR